MKSVRKEDVREVKHEFRAVEDHFSTQEYRKRVARCRVENRNKKTSDGTFFVPVDRLSICYCFFELYMLDKCNLDYLFVCGTIHGLCLY